MAEDFTDLYVFNLRGNQRTAGEQSRKEGGKVFGAGSRSTIAITIGVKDPEQSHFNLRYRDIGDYLTAEEKLEIVDRSSISAIDWKTIAPNDEGDWLSQRDEQFGSWPVLAAKQADDTETFFRLFSAGLKTGRDSWAYATTPVQLVTNIERLTKTYRDASAELQRWLEAEGINRPSETDVNDFLRTNPGFADTQSISWNRTLKNHAAKGTDIQVLPSRIYRSLYRPFTKRSAYFDAPLNDMVYQLRQTHPTNSTANIGVYVVGNGSAVPFSLLATNLLPDLHVTGAGSGGQYFPRFTWDPVEATDGGLFAAGGASKDNRESSVYGQVGEVVDGYVRVDNVTDEIKRLYRDALGENITGDDIFHFVYGKLHDPEYRTKYAADLKKMLPHIETPGSREEFDKFVVAGKQLIDLHINYEDVEPWPLDVQVKGDPDDRETWRVIKPKWKKKKDLETGKNVNDTTTMIYNKFVTITGIPEEAEEYQLGSRSALGWIIDRYQVKKDKASGIVNDPNDWADEVGNPRYIVDLVGKVTRVAMETNRIVHGLKE